MGQRLLVARVGARGHADAPARVRVSERPLSLAVLSTELGWFGLLGRGRGRDATLSRLFLGHASAEQVRSAAADQAKQDAGEAAITEEDWHPTLRRAIEDFSRGVPTDFDHFKIDFGEGTPFRLKVLKLTRAIGYGQKATYGQLAARAGKPGAARAVGAVMASNRLPIIIPCHRVVASGGSLGGFSAVQGVELKRRLLEMEAAAFPDPV